MQFKKTIGAAAVALAMAGFGSAQAGPMLMLSDGTTTITCADGDVSCDANALAGVVTYVGAVGLNFVVNVSTGLGDAISPTNLIDLNSVNVGLAGGSLTIALSDTDYTHIGVIGGHWGGTLSTSGSAASVSARAYAGLSNVLFAQDMLLGSLGPFSSGAFSSSFTNPGPVAGPYSLTQVVTFTSNGPVVYSGDFELKIPEPSALALVGAGLLGIGAIRRRRKA